MERGEAEKREELSDEEFVAGLGTTPLTEEEKSLVEDVHEVLSGAGYIFDAADLLDSLVYVFEGDFKNVALSAVAAVPIVGSGIKTVKVLKNAAEVAGVLAGAKKLADAARKAAKATKAAEEVIRAAKTTTKGAGESRQYTQKIKWGIQDVDVRPAGEGFFGQRTQQINPRVDVYELKINPNNESYYLKFPSGGYVQYKNMVNDVVIDGKLVIQQKSFYHVNDLPEFARNKVLQEATRQVEAANNVRYTVEWLVSDPKAVAQLTDFFKNKNINIVVKYFPE